MHTGGHEEVSEGPTQLLAGVPQRYQASIRYGLLHCGGFPRFRGVASCLGAAGPFNRLGDMNDTTWCIAPQSDLLVFGSNLEKAGLPNNLFSSGPKALLLVAVYEGLRITFLLQAVYIGESRMPLHQET